jgi:hypothetical protein
MFRKTSGRMRELRRYTVCALRNMNDNRVMHIGRISQRRKDEAIPICISLPQFGIGCLCKKHDLPHN